VYAIVFEVGAAFVCVLMVALVTVAGSEVVADY
jgi:hypothetical protein